YEPPFGPTRQGFTEFRGLLSGDGDHHTHRDREGRLDWWHGEERVAEEGYTAELLTRHSVAFIERHRDRPFLLYVPHLAIHFPWQGPGDPPHRTAARDYEDEKWGRIPDPGNVAPHVQAMVESLDAGVGAIVAALRRLGIAERTLVFFSSDHGGYSGGTDYAPAPSTSAPVPSAPAPATPAPAPAAPAPAAPATSGGASSSGGFTP
ncbi:MAG: sulfatase-like hydrolase/transferase, partial [Solirubrobacterales bacterium]